MMTNDSASGPQGDDAANDADAPDALTLEALLAEKDQQVADLTDRLVRQVADMDNMRKRLEKEKQDASAYAVSSFARDLLAVADNLGRALAAIPETARADTTISTLIVGVEMTEKELIAVLGRNGIQRQEAKGVKFDPNLHQAMAEVETTTQEPGTVVDVFQPAYMIKDRLLRPAMVTVAKAPAGGESVARVDTTV
jgi:molecular chaperone GrpE